MKNSLNISSIVLLILFSIVSTTCFSQATVNIVNNKVLIVVTSHEKMGNTGKKTGYYLSEVTHPFFKLEKAGCAIDIASPKGGKAPMDESSRKLSDKENKKFLETPSLLAKLNNTKLLASIDPKEYSAVLFAGGHGTMWDFPLNTDINRISRSIYENGGVVAAVCHGPAALVNITLSGGKHLIDGKTLTAFSNDEEEKAGLREVMPFLLESKLIERGADFKKAGLWAKNVIVSERLVTGQNPASAAGVGEEIVRLLSSKWDKTSRFITKV